MNADKKNEDNFLLGFSDVRLILEQAKLKIIFASAFTAVLVLLYVLIRSPQYTVEASFREKQKSPSEGNKNLSLALILGSQEGSENAAVSLMKSKKLLAMIIKEQGTQVRVKKNQFSSQTISNFKDNLLIEWAYLGHSQKPVIADNKNEISFQNVVYNDEIPDKLQLKFTSEDTFVLYRGKNQEIGGGQFGVPFKKDKLEFTLIRKTDSPLNGNVYTVQFLPMMLVIDKIKKDFFVTPDMADKSLLKLTYKHRDRFEAAEFLNMHMQLYQKYLITEHRRVTQEQIKYLNKRQNETAEQLKTMMEEHALSLSSNMSTMESLFTSQQAYSQRLMSIDFELKRLKRAQEESLTSWDGVDNGVINQILGEIRNHKQQADSIEIALRKAPRESLETLNKNFVQLSNEMEDVRQTGVQARQILALVEKDENLPPQLSLNDHPELMIKSWTEKLRSIKDDSESLKEEYSYCKGSFCSYLTNIIHQLDVEEKLIHERLTHQKNSQMDFQGIDLSTANQLYINYSTLLNDTEADILHYQFIIGRMQESDFEPSSLSSVLNDPVSKDIIVKASSLELMLKDENHRTQKELDRIKDELSKQRSFLLLHVKQTIQLLQLREKLFKEKVLSVQNAQLQLIQQNISVLEKHLGDYIASRITNYKQEKEAIEQQQAVLQAEMEKMPEKWAAEKLIDQHLEMSKRMVEEITKLVESKNISTNLDITQSAPLDFAVPPLHPENPHLIFFVFLGSVIGGLLSIGFILTKASIQGVLATQKNLNLMGLDVVGTFSKPYKTTEPLTDSDLETLRRLMASFFADQFKNKGQPLLLLIGKGIDYSPYFAELLTRSGIKVLLLPVSFDSYCEPSQLPGLMQYFEGSALEPKIEHGANYDTIACGGISRFSNEFLATQRFADLIKKYEQVYDCIMIVSKVSISSGEAANLLHLFDHAVISVIDEKIHDLKICMDLTEPYPNKHLAFIISSAATHS